MGARILRGWETTSDKKVGGAAQHEAQQGEHADGPGPAELGEQGLEHQREDDAANGAAGGREARGEAAAAHEEVAYGREGRSEEEGACEACKGAEGENEVPQFWKKLLAIMFSVRQEEGRMLLSESLRGEATYQSKY